jgi:hypothetical protein
LVRGSDTRSARLPPARRDLEVLVMLIRVTSDQVTHMVLDRLLPQHGLSLSGAENVALKGGGQVSQGVVCAAVF